MGCDGGTIPKRDELVRTKKKPEQVSKEVNLSVKWNHCAMSQETLKPPLVSCELGRLFNKESVIEFLLDKSNQESASKFGYIRGLKDIKELQLTVNPAHTAESDTAIAGEDKKISQYICPVTGLEMNGHYRFCYLLGCGCVFAERALNEIKDGLCVKCGKTYAPDDVIPLNGTEEDIEHLQKKMEQRRLAAKETKKSKKSKSSASAAATGETSSMTNGAAAKDEDAETPPEKRPKLSLVDTAVEEALRSKTGGEAPGTANGKASHQSGKSKLCADRKGGDGGHGGDQQKKPKSIQKDPNASETYKSLFSSHESAKKQPKAHWVTHNPLYF